MRAYTLHEIQEVVSRLAKQYGAKRVYLFGSYARGDMTDSSDIDLRIDKGDIRVFQLAGFCWIWRTSSVFRLIWSQPPVWTSVSWIPFGVTRYCFMKPLDRNISILEHIGS